MVRDDVTSALDGAVLIGNSVLRVMSDAKAGLAHLVLRYIDWLSRQLIPDTAETDWLDRHGDIWLTNADGSTGRKGATLASGTVTFTGVSGTTVPVGTEISNLSVSYETTEEITIGDEATECSVIALDPGVIGNLDAGDTLSLTAVIAGVDGDATVVSLGGGTEEETDDELRMRVLERIREPPMGGDAEDYVAWALSYPGVTRAWCAPNEMGAGTVTVRFMCDNLRATDDPLTNGFPTPIDVLELKTFLNVKRPVAIKDFFVEAPLPRPLVLTIIQLSEDSTSTRASIKERITEMLFEKARPSHAINGVLQTAQTIYAAWVSDAIMQATGVEYFHLDMDDAIMPNNGSLAVLTDVNYSDIPPQPEVP